MANATERLRAMLDERGVEYETYIEQPTGFEHVKWNFNKHGSADFNLEFGEPWLTMYGTISGPEQAIVATLGVGTCHIAERNGDWYCDACGEMVGTCDTASELVIDGNAIELWHFCPNCGRKIEAVDA